ncbi:MAG: molybdopterin-dependent oxidoreductase [Actinobacteria bacterium]|nr:molybdopterin-dependent oxidoreductase [Actinomycetota bacterium]
MAECHPVGFQWVVEAQAGGANVFHVDPRFTRTSALADTHVPLRAGTDIAFLGGIVNYILHHELDFREYVLAYTNASTIVDEHFRDTEDLDGLFSGLDHERRVYDPATWQYEGMPATPAAGRRTQGQAHEQAASHEHGSHGATLEGGEPRRDPTLQHPRCVYQILRRHFSRYTPEMVEQVCGTPQHLFLELCRQWTRNSGRERTTALVYSVGWTQHTVGVQYIRTASIIQLLLGNMGRPGGGILALRGHASIQGSTDIPTLYNLLPGYLPMPHAGSHPDLSTYLDTVMGQRKVGYWGRADAYMASLLKAWWGDAAQADNDFCFDHLPRVDGDHGTYQTVMDMIEGKVKGYFLLGQNPAVGSAHGKAQRLGMANLDWLVVRDLFAIESATWWKDGPEIATGEIVPEECRTEVFLLPAAAHVEKEGTFTQTQRLLQWRERALAPKDDCRSELWFFFHLGRIIRDKLSGSTDERDRPLLDLTWDYPTAGEHDEPSADAVLREINGYDLSTGELLDSFTGMRGDGTTTGGCWIYTGVYAGGVNQAARRTPGTEQGHVAGEWGWAWPSNRRILYNRASADPEGRPWSQRKAYVWWDAQRGEWTGEDVPDFERGKPPDYRPPADAVAEDAIAGDDPFVMQADGKGWLFVPSGLLDGPLPTHYEPAESPVANALYRQQTNPARQVFPHPVNPSQPESTEPGNDVFPFVFTTSRLTEHHTAGGMSRYVPYLAELQPELFIEVSPQLAAERGLSHLGWAHMVTARSAVEARVLVTERLAPLRVGDRVLHQVCIPYHWAHGGGLTTGDSANDLVGITLDPNVHIQETKVGACDLRPGRRPTGAALLRYVEGYRRRAGITIDTGNHPVRTDRPGASP